MKFDLKQAVEKGVEQALTECELSIGMTLKEAVEKQIPKKPILDTIFPSGVKWYLCAACNHNNIEHCDCYCHNCGQALDWSDTDEQNDR